REKSREVIKQERPVVRRQLSKDGPEPSAQALHLPQELQSARDRRSEHVFVRHISWQLRAEGKPGGRFRSPPGNRLRVRDGVEGRIALDGSQAPAVEAQEISLTAVRGIEITDPAFVGPDRTTEGEISPNRHKATITGGQRQNKGRGFLLAFCGILGLKA